MSTNNEKKRFGRKAFFGEQAIILISAAFVLCMFHFNDLNLGLKWLIVYAVAIFGISGLTSGLLSKQDLKELAMKFNPLKKINGGKNE